MNSLEKNEPSGGISIGEHSGADRHTEQDVRCLVREMKSSDSSNSGPIQEHTIFYIALGSKIHNKNVWRRHGLLKFKCQRWFNFFRLFSFPMYLIWLSLLLLQLLLSVKIRSTHQLKNRKKISVTFSHRVYRHQWHVRGTCACVSSWCMKYVQHSDIIEIIVSMNIIKNEKTECISVINARADWWWCPIQIFPALANHKHEEREFQRQIRPYTSAQSGI